LSELNFIHRWIPAESLDAPVLLLLHGTGGNENDLIEVGRAVAPGCSLLSLRGKVLEGGMPRFFRRFAEGVFDEADIRNRAAELAEFIGAAAAEYGFYERNVWALGYSNGANIAAAILLLYPEVLAGAVLLRAMVPLVPDEKPDLTGARVLLCEGTHDPIVPLENAEELTNLLRWGGADVELRWQAGGHGLTADDIGAAHDFLMRD
jgi:phospholipase/carboxylesterase